MKRPLSYTCDTEHLLPVSFRGGYKLAVILRVPKWKASFLCCGCSFTHTPAFLKPFTGNGIETGIKSPPHTIVTLW